VQMRRAGSWWADHEKRLDDFDSVVAAKQQRVQNETDPVKALQQADRGPEQNKSHSMESPAFRVAP